MARSEVAAARSEVKSAEAKAELLAHKCVTRKVAH